MENSNRVIKFRCWDTIENKMTFFTLFNPLDFPHTPWIQQKVMQYTGLLDKNGKEIYEGDIVEFKDDKNSRWVVEYKEQSFEPALLNEGVIIGNIYEHSNLINNKEIK